MPENYDTLVEEVSESKSAPTPNPQNSGQQPPQLSKSEFAAKMKTDRESLTVLANNTGAEIAANSGKFQQYLNTLSRFERYSPQNTLLIHAQNPDAVKLGDYDYWKSAGTSVSKGETGIRIFEPGKEYTKDDGSVGVSMNIKRVFDVSQTAAQSKAQPDNSEVKHDIRTLLKSLISNSPVPVKLADSLPDGAGARYDEQSNVIEVVRGLDGESLFRCMAQEVAYAQLDHQNTETLTCNDKGFAAYAASYVICRKYGIDTKGYDFSDSPDYFKGRDGKEIRGEIKAIRDTVNDIAGRMAKTLEAPQRNGDAR